jgi:outer membrane lipoprotein
MRARPLLLVIVALLAGCATKPVFKDENAKTDVSPQEVMARNVPDGTRIIWGGVIVATTNLKDSTQIEILAYPLDKQQRPKTESAPLGRFLAIRPGYLESADYSPGRSITVIGPLSGTRHGKIGEIEYTYPVLSPEKTYLWPREAAVSEPSSRVHFGVGVGVMFH